MYSISGPFLQGVFIFSLIKTSHPPPIVFSCILHLKLSETGLQIQGLS
jgi:hypothetical protein